MSHIDNITRATKAYHTLASATNYHLTLVDMIMRLYDTGSLQPVSAAYKDLTNERMPKGAPPAKLIRQFCYSLDIEADSLKEKLEAVNEFGNDIFIECREDHKHECAIYGAPYEHAGGR